MAGPVAAAGALLKARTTQRVIGAVGKAVLSVVVTLVVALTAIVGMSGHDRQALAAADTTLNAASIPNGWAPWVARAGSVCPEFPPAVIAAQIEAESAWNARAQSPAGAVGLSQFIPSTWASVGRDDDRNGVASPYDPGDAIMAQGRYDCQLVDQLRGHVDGDLTSLGLAAYNAGPGAVLNANGIPPYPETQSYVPRILGLAAKYGAVTGTAATGDAGAVIAAARRMLGTPYSWGGGGPNGPARGFAQGAATVGFDCSSLMQYAFWQGARVTLPRTTVPQSQGGHEVPRFQLAAGDIIVFDTDHVGLYIGNGQMIHAPQTGDVVKVTTIVGNSYWESRTWHIRRYL